ncbi:MAG: hypothetical protein D6820_11345 [Lentisphaerae bacterium]|nr:MAG: hypothetical protein D6820_11345 [Lentisphaerota bacterium]
MIFLVWACSCVVFSLHAGENEGNAAFLKRALYKMKQKDYDEVIRMIIANAQFTTREVYLLGLAYEKKGCFLECIEQYLQLIKRHREDPKAAVAAVKRLHQICPALTTKLALQERYAQLIRSVLKIDTLDALLEDNSSSTSAKPAGPPKTVPPKSGPVHAAEPVPAEAPHQASSRQALAPPPQPEGKLKPPPGFHLVHDIRTGVYSYKPVLYANRQNLYDYGNELDLRPVRARFSYVICLNDGKYSFFPMVDTKFFLLYSGTTPPGWRREGLVRLRAQGNRSNETWAVYVRRVKAGTILTIDADRLHGNIRPLLCVE